MQELDSIQIESTTVCILLSVPQSDDQALFVYRVHVLQRAPQGNGELLPLAQPSHERSVGLGDRGLDDFHVQLLRLALRGTHANAVPG